LSIAARTERKADTATLSRAFSLIVALAAAMAVFLRSDVTA
jgi:hypothetical protein